MPPIISPAMGSQLDNTQPSIKPAQKYYRAELDALRFVAFGLVFLHHIVPREISMYEKHFNHTVSEMICSIADLFGYGLSLFFFLSAFLITELLIREKQKTNTIDIRKFYIRRVLRIWPLYFFGILAGISIAFVSGSIDGIIDMPPLKMVAMFSTMIGNWYVAGGVSDAWPKNPITPLWSISIEEQFYLFWPSIILLFTRNRVFVACGVMFLLAIATEILLGSYQADTDKTIWTNSFVQFELFAAGAVLSLITKGRSPNLKGGVRLLLVVAGFGAWFASSFWLKAKYHGPATSWAAVAFGYLFITAGCAALMLAVLGVRKPQPAVVYLGRISFGLYVFHMVPLYAMKIVSNHYFSDSIVIGIVPKFFIGLPCTIILASLSYKYLETPFLNLKERYTVIGSRPV